MKEQDAAKKENTEWMENKRAALLPPSSFKMFMMGKQEGEDDTTLTF
jgi:hypothetical protein